MRPCLSDQKPPLIYESRGSDILSGQLTLTYAQEGFARSKNQHASLTQPIYVLSVTGPPVRLGAGLRAKTSAKPFHGLPCTLCPFLLAAAGAARVHFAEHLGQFQLSLLFLLLQLCNKWHGRRHSFEVIWAYRGVLWGWRSELLPTDSIHDSEKFPCVAGVLLWVGATLNSVMVL